MDAAARSRKARKAALTRWSQQDTKAGTAAAREGFRRKFEEQVDPDGTLAPDERYRRAKRAMRAHMMALNERRSKGA